LLYNRNIAGDTTASAVAVDTQGNAYLAGTSLALDFPAVNALEAQTPVKSLFVTNDGGGTWRALNNNLAALTINSLAIDPTRPATLYAATSIGLYKSLDDRSADGGAHWSDVHDFPASFIGQGDSLSGGVIVVDPTNSSRVYACCAYQLVYVVPAVFRTEDGGKTWVEGGRANFSNPVVDPRNGATLYASSGTGLLQQHRRRPILDGRRPPVHRAPRPLLPRPCDRSFRCALPAQ
jgi:hypothetical protein